MAFVLLALCWVKRSTTLVLSYPILRQAEINPHLSVPQVRANRLEMEESLARILGEILQPRNMPVIFLCDKEPEICDF